MDRKLHHELPETSDSVTYRRPTQEDVLTIVRGMRRSDVRELLEGPFNNNRTVLEIASGCRTLSEHAWVACKDGVPFIMFGMQYANEHVGHPWMFGTNVMTSMRLSIAKESPAWLEVMRGSCQILTNIFDRRNLVHIRWAENLGFVKDSVVEINPNFQYMTKRYFNV